MKQISRLNVIEYSVFDYIHEPPHILNKLNHKLKTFKTFHESLFES